MQSNLVVPIVGPIYFRLNRLFWFPIKNANEINRMLFEKRSRENLDIIINRVTKKEFVSRGILAIPKAKGIAFLEKIELKEPYLFDKKSGITLHLGQLKEIHPRDEDIRRLINSFLSQKLREVCHSFSKNEYYFEQETIYKFKNIKFLIYQGLRFQTIFHQNHFYLILLNRYKPLILPTMDKLLSLPEFEGITAEINLAGIPLNTISEYSLKFGKPAFAGRLKKIIWKNKKEYMKRLNNIIKYYEKEGEAIYKYIEKKLLESPNQPIIEVTQRNYPEPLYYLSSLLVLTPSTSVISNFLEHIIGTKDITRKILKKYYEIVTPLPSKYMSLSIKWLEKIKEIIQNSSFLKTDEKFGFIKMRRDITWH